jgi:hypothetical protein
MASFFNSSANISDDQHVLHLNGNATCTSYSDYVNRRRLRHKQSNRYNSRTSKEEENNDDDDDDDDELLPLTRTQERRNIKMVDNERTSLLSGIRGSSAAAGSDSQAEQREETWTTKDWTTNENEQLPLNFQERKKEKKKKIVEKFREQTSSLSLPVKIQERRQRKMDDEQSSPLSIGRERGGSQPDDESLPVRNQQRRLTKIKVDEQTSSLSIKRERTSSFPPTTTARMRRIGAKENEADTDARIAEGRWAFVKKAVHEEQKVNEYKNNGRNSMIYMGQLPGVGKPVNKWYRGLVVRQWCHSHLASNYLRYDLNLNTLSVALTAITSSAIFTSLSPASVASNVAELELDGDTTTGGSDINSYNSGASNRLANKLALAAGCIAAFNTILQAVMQTLVSIKEVFRKEKSTQ